MVENRFCELELEAPEKHASTHQAEFKEILNEVREELAERDKSMARWIIAAMTGAVVVVKGGVSLPLNALTRTRQDGRANNLRVDRI